MPMEPFHALIVLSGSIKMVLAAALATFAAQVSIRTVQGKAGAILAPKGTTRAGAIRLIQ